MPIRPSLAVAAILVLAGAANAQEPPRCNMQQIASIPVTFVRNKPYIKVGINGQPVYMLADTGAQRSLLFNQAARRMGMNPVYEGGEFVGVGGTRAALSVTVAKFTLGDAAPTKLRLFAIDQTGWPDDVVGVIGQDLFGQAETEFDLAAGVIRLFAVQHCERANLAYWSKEPMVADMRPGGLGVGSYDLELKLNGKIVVATLDSGAQTSVITTEAATHAGAHPSSERVDDVVRGIGAEKVEVSTVVFETLAIGDEEIKNAKLKVGDYYRAARETETGSRISVAAGAPEMLLGADFFRSHRVLISRSQKRMYFTYAGGPVFQVVAPAQGPEGPGAAKPAGQ